MCDIARGGDIDLVSDATAGLESSSTAKSANSNKEKKACAIIPVCPCNKSFFLIVFFSLHLACVALSRQTQEHSPSLFSSSSRRDHDEEGDGYRLKLCGSADANDRIAVHSPPLYYYFFCSSPSLPRLVSRPDITAIDGLSGLLVDRP